MVIFLKKTFVKLTLNPVKKGDTALARMITVKKMELNAVVYNFSKEERNAMRARLACWTTRRGMTLQL